MRKPLIEAISIEIKSGIHLYLLINDIFLTQRSSENVIFSSKNLQNKTHMNKSRILKNDCG